MVSSPNEFPCVLQADSYCHNTGHILCICIYLCEYSHVDKRHSNKNNCSAVAEMGDHLVIIDTGRKVGAAVSPFWGRGAGSHLTQCGLGRGLPSFQVASGSIEVFGHKTRAEYWEVVPLWEKGAGCPCNTMWPGPKPTSTPSFIFIHSTVWSQYSNVTDRTNRQTTVPQHRANRSTNGRRKMFPAFRACIPVFSSGITQQHEFTYGHLNFHAD